MSFLLVGGLAGYVRNAYPTRCLRGSERQLTRYFPDDFLLTTAVRSSFDTTSFGRFDKPILGVPDA
jgi:hypothetical protein